MLYHLTTGLKVKTVSLDYNRKDRMVHCTLHVHKHPHIFNYKYIVFCRNKRDIIFDVRECQRVIVSSLFHNQPRLYLMERSSLVHCFELV